MAAKNPKQSGIPASVIAEQIDELGALEKEIAPIKPKLTRIELLRKAVRAHFDASPADKAFEARGERFAVVVGPRAVERFVNPAKLIKAIGLKVYASLLRPTLKSLEDEKIAPEIVANVVESAQTGPRPVKTFERPAA